MNLRSLVRMHDELHGADTTFLHPFQTGHDTAPSTGDHLYIVRLQREKVVGYKVGHSLLLREDPP